MNARVYVCVQSDVTGNWSVNRDDMESLSRRYQFSSWREISVKDNVGVDEAIRSPTTPTHPHTHNTYTPTSQTDARYGNSININQHCSNMQSQTNKNKRKQLR